MKITIFNIKGGQGKTSIAGNLALTMNAGIITNDIYSPLEAILPSNQFIKVHPKDSFPIIPEDVPIIYDLGGWVDTRIVPVLKGSDLIIIPVINDFVNNQVTLNTLEEARKYNKNISIVVNRAEKGDFECISTLINNFYSQEHPILELKKTTAFSKIFEKQKSIQKIIEEDKVFAFAYRQVSEQFDHLIEHINQRVL
jgi:cellulose biosynthesis protein BcsQ